MLRLWNENVKSKKEHTPISITTEKVYELSDTLFSFLNKHNSILIAVKLQQILVAGPELVKLC